MCGVCVVLGLVCPIVLLDRSMVQIRFMMLVSIQVIIFFKIE